VIGAALAAAVLGLGAAPAEPRVLVVTETAGFRHASIPAARAALEGLGRRSAAFDVVALRSSRSLTPTALRGARAVVFLSTTGDLTMGPAGRARLLRWIRGGGSFVGLHAASNTFPRSPAFARMLGARFEAHPFVGRGRVTVTDRGHPATARLPASFAWEDEFYVFDRRVRAHAHVLARRGGIRGDQPLVWTRSEGRGRVLYSALGHRAAAWRDPVHLRLLQDGLAWATRP
jgi:type 1 glutamine amidotransferase